MDIYEYDFVLPLGFNDEKGNLIKRGKMRPATAYDELMVQNDDNNKVNPRYRDILILSRVVTEIEGNRDITPQLIEELYEVDFIYLQMLYKEINSTQGRKAEVRCPSCGHLDQISMGQLYDDMGYNYEEEEETQLPG